LGDRERVAGSSGVIDHASIWRPIRLNAKRIVNGRSPEEGDSPHGRVFHVAAPKPDIPIIGEKSEAPNLGVSHVPNLAFSQIVEAGAASLTGPDVDLACSIGEKGHELAVPRDRGVYLSPRKIRYVFESSVGTTARFSAPRQKSDHSSPGRAH